MKSKYKAEFIDMEKLESQVLDWLRFPMIVLVVYIHYWGENIAYSDSLGYTIYNSTRILMCHVISRAAVPVFFLISGYYFFKNIDIFNRTIYIEKLTKRIKTILIPYLIWNILVILQVIARKIGAYIIKGKPLNDIVNYFQDNGWINLFWGCNVWEGRTDWFGYIHDSTGPVLVPMWYLRDLMVFFVLTPIIFYCIKRLKHWTIILLTFCYISNIWPNISGFSTSIVFFVTGAYLAINRKNIISECYRHHNLLYLIVLIMLPFMVIFDSQYTPIGNIIYPLFILALVPCYINIATSLLTKGVIKPPPRLSNASFFIFALHVMILGYCSSLVKFIIPNSSWYFATIQYLITPMICVLTCYIIYIIMLHNSPRLLKVLYGNRSLTKKYK